MIGTPKEQRVRVNGVDLAYFEWRRDLRGREAPILLVHATGFHARVWDPVVERLGERYVISLDQRGHGRSAKTGITHWNVFGQDLVEFVRALDLRNVLGVGHSMGGHAMVDAAAALPDRFRRLVLIDPVIAAPEAYGGGGWMISRLKGEKHPTAKRKRRFQSPDEMIERFRDRVPYRAFHPEALRDGREIHFPDHTHFLPMEIPDRIAELILAEGLAAKDDSLPRPESARAR